MSGKLYISETIDGREVLKPAELPDVRRWLYHYNGYTDPQYVVMHSNHLRSLTDLLREYQKAVAPFEIEKKLTQ